MSSAAELDDSASVILGECIKPRRPHLFRRMPGAFCADSFGQRIFLSAFPARLVSDDTRARELLLLLINHRPLRNNTGSSILDIQDQHIAKRNPVGQSSCKSRRWGVQCEVRWHSSLSHTSTDDASSTSFFLRASRRFTKGSSGSGSVSSSSLPSRGRLPVSVCRTAGTEVVPFHRSAHAEVR